MHAPGCAHVSVCFASFIDLPTGWEEGYTFEGARCFIKWVLIPSHHNTHPSTYLQKSYKFKALPLCLPSELLHVFIRMQLVFITSLQFQINEKLIEMLLYSSKQNSVLEAHIARAEIWNLYSQFVCCRSLSQKLMITQEHCASNKPTWAKCGHFFLKVSIYLDSSRLRALEN